MYREKTLKSTAEMLRLMLLFLLQVASDGGRTVCCGQEVVLGAGRIRHGSGDLGRRTVRDLLQGKDEVINKSPDR